MSEDLERTPEQEPRRPGPIGGDMAAIVYGLARRMRVPALVQRYDSTFILGLFALVNGVIAIGIMAFVAEVTGEPFVFPSLGPTAFLLFYTPMVAAASPRNTVCGHAIGAAAGYLALVVFGLTWLAFDVGFLRVVKLEPLFVAVLVLRNLCLLACVVVSIRWSLAPPLDPADA